MFYAGNEQRAAQVNRLFAAIARRYDLINDVQSFGLHRFWKRRVINLGSLRPGLRALDVCCGTGDLALAMADRGAEVTGLDFSEPMLAIAERRRQKCRQRRLAKLNFIPGDAQQIPCPDNSFDVVTIGYGLRNLSSWETGLAEMCRVARPGGRLIVLDFGKPENAAWRAVYFTHLRCCVPLIGWLFCGNAQAYGYILESLKHFPAQQAVAARMRELKLTNMRVINLLGGAMAINYGEKPA